MNANLSVILGDRKLIVAFFVLLVAALLIGNATASLWDQDEAAYAGFARSMVEDHHWVVPDFPYTHPHRKVPLAFWLIAASFEALGINEFALRLPSLLAIVATAVCLCWGGRFLLGAGVAKLAAMMLVSSLLVLNLGKIALTDGVLLVFQTVAALALLRGAVKPSWRATVILWLAVAGGLLAKGPPILILVGGMFVFLLIFYPRRRNLIHLHPWFGLPLALVPLAVWIYLAWQQDQRYVLFLGYWYVLRRVGGTTFGHGGPPGTYFLLFFVCLIPWTGYLLTALADVWRRIRKRRLPFLLIASWLFGGWIIWELLSSKLPTYTVGAFPALALLLARQVQRNLAGRITWRTHRSLRVGSYVLVVVCAALAVVLLGLGVWLGAPWAKVLAILPAAAIAFLGWSALRFQRRAEPAAAVKTLLLGSLAANLLIWMVLVPGIEPRRSATRQVADTIASLCRPETTVVVAKNVSSPSLPFYVRQNSLRFQDAGDSDAERPPLEVDWSLLWKWQLRELAQKVKAQNPPEPTLEEKRQARLERVTQLSRSDRPLAFVLDEQQYDELRDQLAGGRVIRIDGWLSDRFADTTYVIAITPAALKPALATQAAEASRPVPE